MKKIIFGMLLLGGNLFAMHNQNMSKEDKERCEVVSQALLLAHMHLYFKHDDSFPKRTSEFTVHADFPASFTTAQANACSCSRSYAACKPKNGEMITINPAASGQQGSVTIKLERADYDTLAEEVYNKKMNNRMKTVERIFDYYNID